MAASPDNRKFEDFFEAFCHRYHCEPEDYEKKAFSLAVPPLRRPFVLPFFYLLPDRFDLDLDIIQELGKTRTRDEFAGVLDEFHNAMRVERSRFKRFLGMRMHGSRLMEIREEMDDLIEPAASRRKMAAAAVAPSTPAPVTSAAQSAPASVPSPSRAPARAAHAPSESRALVLRKLRQAHGAIVEGKPMAQALDAAGLTEEQFLEQLAAEAGANPSFGWLRDQLLRQRRLADAEQEIARLNRAVADQSREIAELRDRQARLPAA